MRWVAEQKPWLNNEALTWQKTLWNSQSFNRDGAFSVFSSSHVYKTCTIPNYLECSLYGTAQTRELYSSGTDPQLRYTFLPLRGPFSSESLEKVSKQNWIQVTFPLHIYWAAFLGQAEGLAYVNRGRSLVVHHSQERLLGLSSQKSVCSSAHAHYKANTKATRISSGCHRPPPVYPPCIYISYFLNLPCPPPTSWLMKLFLS